MRSGCVDVEDCRSWLDVSLACDHQYERVWRESVHVRPEGRGLDVEGVEGVVFAIDP